MFDLIYGRENRLLIFRDHLPIPLDCYLALSYFVFAYSIMFHVGIPTTSDIYLLCSLFL